MGKLIPIVIVLIGLGAGLGAGLALRPTAAPEVKLADMGKDNPCGEMLTAAAVAPTAPAAKALTSEFVNLSNQFVFPLVERGEVAALVVLSLSLELVQGQTEAAYLREPKLRDGFLRVLLDHANAGGFDGTFTENGAMESLRRALVEVGREELGDALIDVLIQDINRQDA